MGYFFDVVPIDEAVAIVRRIAHETGTETISIDEADGRVIAESISAPSDIPGFDRSWKDGFAVLSSDTYQATESMPVVLTCTGRIPMGRCIMESISPGECKYIPTGGHLPGSSDAVVMIEYTERIGNSVMIKRPVTPGENIIRKDEDFKAGDQIFPAGWTLRPQDIGVLASIGHTRITVRRMPRIGVISTGLELVPAEAVPHPGEVREVNSHLISVFIRRQGAVPIRYGIIRDDLEELKRTLSRASSECDALIVSGGSSKDKNDITSTAIEALGKVFVHGISIAPGKPTIIGTIGTIPIIGLPGHPASTFMVLSLVVIHLVQAMKGSPCQRTYKKTVRMATNVPSERGREHYIRVRIEGNLATPILGKSGLLNTLSQSDGIVKIPAGKEGCEAGEEVEVMMW